MPGGHAASACPYTTNAAFVASQQPSAPVPAAARPPETSPQTRTTSQHRTITQPRLRRSPDAQYAEGAQLRRDIASLLDQPTSCAFVRCLTWSGVITKYRQHVLVGGARGGVSTL